MTRRAILATAVLAACMVSGCGPKVTRVRTERETTETVRSREILLTGDQPGESATAPDSEGTTTTRKTTRRRVIERGPVVK